MVSSEGSPLRPRQGFVTVGVGRAPELVADDALDGEGEGDGGHSHAAADHDAVEQEAGSLLVAARP